MSASDRVDITQRSHAKSSADDLGAGRGVVHGRAVQMNTLRSFETQPLSTGRFVLPTKAGLRLDWIKGVLNEGRVC